MPEAIADDSVGVVETQFMHFSEALTLERGKTLAEYDIAYETYGELNADARYIVFAETAEISINRPVQSKIASYLLRWH